MLGFTLDTFHSLTHSIRLTAPVALPVSTRVVEDVAVVGREGTLTRRLGWADNVITLELLIHPTPRGSVENAYQQLSLTCLNAKRLELSGKPARFRQVKHASFTPLLREGSWGRTTLTVVCSPFAYHTHNPTMTLTNTAASVITNPGLVDSRPIITVHATGTASFTINSRLHTVNNLASKALIDSQAMTVANGHTRQLTALSGGFPLLNPGSNQVSLGSGVSRFEVVGN